MYNKTNKIIVPIREYLATRKSIGRDKLYHMIRQACKANQLDNWNNGDTREGDTLFVPKTMDEKILWNAIREENLKLFQRSKAGRQPRDMQKKIDKGPETE